MSESKKGFVTLRQRPRPDHPGEQGRPVMVREDLIGMVVIDDFKYEPDNAAKVAVLPNARILKGEATFVFTVTGSQFVVKETPDEVMQLIKEAREGVTKLCDYTPEEPAVPAAVLANAN